MNQQLYIWYNRNYLNKKGIPSVDNIKLFDTYDKVKNKFYNKSQWMVFDYKPMEFPPLEDIYKFPINLFLVLKKKTKNIQFDYLEYGSNVKIVSDKFLFFLIENGMQTGYEQAKVTIVDGKANILDVTDYYALRFGMYDDDLFSLNEGTRRRGKHLFGSTYYTYPNLEIKNHNINKNVFTISPLPYRETLIFKDFLLKKIFENFYLPEIYKLEDFPYVYDNQFKEDLGEISVIKIQ